MKLALSLAQKGIGNVEPNPAVGCVIVKNGKIIGKGYHKKFGGPHAEINALKNCKKSPAGATMYVTLEPCCHFGKTEPCTNAIIKAGIKKVVAAVKDPTEKVAGNGFKILKNAGIQVTTGICQNETQTLNAPFFHFAKTKKPWVIIKWAQSKDEFLAQTGKKRWITNSKSRKDVHNLRRKVQAIVVGINTIITDDPMLTARPNIQKQPARVILDSDLRIPPDCKIVKTAKKIPVIIFSREKNNKKALLLTKKGVEIVAVPSVKKNGLKSLLTELGKINFQQILVEGGQKVITSFLRQKLVNEIIIYTSPEKLAEKGRIKISQPMKKLCNWLKKNYSVKKRFGKDVYLKGFIKQQ